MRYVGEMIRTVQNDVTRRAMYADAATYGLNVDKARWIAGFLLDTGLIDEPRYGSLRATPRGSVLMAELPLAEVLSNSPGDVTSATDGAFTTAAPLSTLRADLDRFAREPLGGGTISGHAFERTVGLVFRAMGFGTRVISGPGNTDVLVQWSEVDGSTRTAVVEAKSRSAGMVTHTDVSDVAIETHKSRHKAEFVAIVGPGFSGDTIKNMADQKHWALISAGELGEILDASDALGLLPSEIASLFRVPGGLQEIRDGIDARRREFDVVSFVLEKLVGELRETGEAISARDISRDGRTTELSPQVDEVLIAIANLERLGGGALRRVEMADDPKFTTYRIGDARAAARRLRAMAGAIELPLGTP